MLGKFTAFGKFELLLEALQSALEYTRLLEAGCYIAETTQGKININLCTEIANHIVLPGEQAYDFPARHMDTIRARICCLYVTMMLVLSRTVVETLNCHCSIDLRRRQCKNGQNKQKGAMLRCCGWQTCYKASLHMSTFPAVGGRSKASP